MQAIPGEECLKRAAKLERGQIAEVIELAQNIQIYKGEAIKEAVKRAK